ncbi:MAG TPA: NTF2 fold immunity protein [Terriglobia bacterium]|nr:NTF2 fold immunity protein [Terriglobia bacterium]
MFERYTEVARRVIFFARYEASHFGSTTIESEHLLLGLIREHPNLIQRFVPGAPSAEDFRKEIAAQLTVRPKISTSIDLPLSLECKRILAYSAEEAERLNHRMINSEHLLLGTLREENCVAANVLRQSGLQLHAIREELARHPMAEEPAAAGVTSGGFGSLSRFLDLHNPALPAADVVPDADTAKRIAEAIWIPQHGKEKIASQQPLKAELKFNVWIVTGSPESEAALFAFILQRDGRILSVGP